MKKELTYKKFWIYNIISYLYIAFLMEPHAIGFDIIMNLIKYKTLKDPSYNYMFYSVLGIVYVLSFFILYFYFKILILKRRLLYLGLNKNYAFLIIILPFSFCLDLYLLFKTDKERKILRDD